MYYSLHSTVFGLVTCMFSLMVNDITLVEPKNNPIKKYTNNITISVPVRINYGIALADVKSIENWV